MAWIRRSGNEGNGGRASQERQQWGTKAQGWKVLRAGCSRKKKDHYGRSRETGESEGDAAGEEEDLPLDLMSSTPRNTRALWGRGGNNLM